MRNFRARTAAAGSIKNNQTSARLVHLVHQRDGLARREQLVQVSRVDHERDEFAAVVGGYVLSSLLQVLCSVNEIGQTKAIRPIPFTTVMTIN